MYLKIIGGKFRGMKIQMPHSSLTRPSKAILKESLFNVLQNDINDCIFIEGFGGSGSIGIEALSRGAKKAIFIESNAESFKILQNNLNKLQDEHLAIFGDTFELLPPLIEKIQENIILYLDPPFCIRSQMQDIYEKCLKLIEEIQNPSLFLIIFEHLSSHQMPQKVANFCIIKSKKFGKSSLTYYLWKLNVRRRKDRKKEWERSNIYPHWGSNRPHYRCSCGCSLTS